ncbi:glycosyltransferase family 4 protein [Chloroflexota bacterium]
MKHSEKTTRLNIALIAEPVGKAGIEILTALIKILAELSDNLYVITGNFPKDRFLSQRIHIENIENDLEKQAKGSRPAIISKFVSKQIKLTLALIKIRRKVDSVFFVGHSPVLPMLVARIFRKRTIRIATASLRREAKLAFGRRSPLYYIAAAVEEICYILAHIIATHGNIRLFKLDRCQWKVLSGTLFIDTTLLKLSKSLEERENTVGYQGRLERVKGVLNFVEAMPLILQENPDVIFSISGDGTLRNEIKERFQKNNLLDKVRFNGWVAREKMPDCFNELKLLILPSYSEGLSIVLLEAMACGTPVLATPVGGIPEVLKDGETGFLLLDNSPQSIAQNVIRVLEHPNLEKITKMGRALIEKEYSFEAAVERYRRILYGGA